MSDDFDESETRNTLNELHLFAGAGGGILGGMLLGHTCVCAVEIRADRRQVLLQRQRDGILPHFPIWDDIKTFDGRPWKGMVDVICGGFPCQDISSANQYGDGIDGERSKLWWEMLRVVCEIRPQYVLVENSPALTFRGLEDILGGLAAGGYDARWDVFGAGHIGAWHLRKRIWICAHAIENRRHNGWVVGQEQKRKVLELARLGAFRPWKDSKPAEKCKVLGVADGMAGQLDRIAAISDGQVPAVVKLAWEVLNS